MSINITNREELNQYIEENFDKDYDILVNYFENKKTLELAEEKYKGLIRNRELYINECRQGEYIPVKLKEKITIPEDTKFEIMGDIIQYFIHKIDLNNIYQVKNIIRLNNDIQEAFDEYNNEQQRFNKYIREVSMRKLNKIKY